MDAGGIGTDGGAAGMGCRGPDKIWPGRGVGTGRAGTGPVRKGGCIGAEPPVDKGGLIGKGLVRSGSSTAADVELRASVAVGVDASNSGVGILAGCAGCSGAASGAVKS